MANQAPTLDGCQDWSVLYGEEKEGWTLVVVSRKLTTEDSNDHPLLLTGLKRTGILAAHGSDSPDYAGSPTYHGATKAKIFVDLDSNAGAVGQAEWSAAKLSDATKASFELRANEASTPGSLTNPERRVVARLPLSLTHPPLPHAIAASLARLCRVAGRPLQSSR